MSSIRVHGSVQPYGNEYVVTFDIAGFTSHEEAQEVNKHVSFLLMQYFEKMRGGIPVDSGTGTPPWKTKQ